MKRIAICDDDRAFASLLAKEVDAFFRGSCVITQFQSSEELRVASLEAPPDIALLDIKLCEENGIALARELFPPHSGTVVIFITGYIEYCTDVYEAEHIYFLLKPIQRQQLHKALTKAGAALETLQNRSPIFYLRTGGTVRRISLANVLYIESFYRKLRVCMADETLTYYAGFSELPAEVSQRMIRCHKSFLVNPEQIVSMNGDSFLMSNGTMVPISHSRKAETRQAYLDYLAHSMEVH